MAARHGFGAQEDEACFWEYDSTWEEEEEGEGEEEEEEEEDGGGEGELEAAAEEDPQDEGEQSALSWAQSCWQAQEPKSNSSPLFQRSFQFSGRRNWNAAEDLQRYRRQYPDLMESENEEEEEMLNLRFYKNKTRFLPQGLFIESLLESWWDNYEVLEENHSYIQWLFPLREPGMNWYAKPLTCREIQAFKKSKEVMQRFIRAYQLMLGFYGIVLINEETGELKRAENWAERFQNLNRFGHNNLRITRILKCLGEMGYEHYQVHLVKFFLTETLVKETLPNVKRSALDYFLFTVRSKQKRRELVHYAWQHFRPRDSFVWGPHHKLLKYRPRSAKSQLQQKAEDKQETPGRKCDDSVDHQNQFPEEEQGAGDAASLGAGDAASLEAGDAASLEAGDAASLGAGDAASLEAGGAASLEAGGAASLEAGGAASLEAGGAASLEAGDAASLEAGDAASLEAGDAASLEAGGAASLEAGDAASLEAGGAASLEAGHAASLQPEVNDKDEKEKRSECPLKGGGDEEAKEASFTQQEEEDLNSEAEEVQSAAENDCTKESKKRKLDANRVDANNGPLKSPTDIENISHNLGECAIDAEIPSSAPLVEAEEDKETLKEDNASTKDPAAPESTDAAVKRRKVDKRTTRNRPCNLAINLNMGIKSNPSVANTEAENDGEENAAVEVVSERSSGDANGGAVGSPVDSRLPKSGWTSPVSDGLEASGDRVTARSDERHCNSTFLQGEGEVDGVEQHQKAENASEKEQAEITGKKHPPESLKQNIASPCPEEDSTEVATHKRESSECAAEPAEEQVAASDTSMGST
ncbi:opioid growth factor receptor isoform X2 [Lathamus discolor]|uniref:opioid growth factor receptor isoform X2 n=1 Tax=Lathamus discolor TaxID=678569 RepID=UPI0032B79D58